MKKLRLCSYCGEPIKQGHRKDRCENLKWSKTHSVSKDRIYVNPNLYKDKRFETIVVNENTFVNIASGANIANPQQVVSGEEFRQNIKEAIKVLKSKLDG